jgi:hypothetical protein
MDSTNCRLETLYPPKTVETKPPFDGSVLNSFQGYIKYDEKIPQPMANETLLKPLENSAGRNGWFQTYRR